MVRSPSDLTVFCLHYSSDFLFCEVVGTSKVYTMLCVVCVLSASLLNVCVLFAKPVLVSYSFL